MCLHLEINPRHNEVYNFFLLRWGQLDAHRDAVPFVQAFSAAAGSRVLCDEHRVPAHGCLLAIFGIVGRRQTGADEVPRVLADGG